MATVSYAVDYAYNVDTFDKHPNTVITAPAYGTKWNKRSSVELQADAFGRVTPVTRGDYAAVSLNTDNTSTDQWVEVDVLVPSSDIDSKVTVYTSIDGVTGVDGTGEPVSSLKVSWFPKAKQIVEENTRAYSVILDDNIGLLDPRGLHTFRVEQVGRTLTAKIDGLSVWTAVIAANVTLTPKVGFGLQVIAGPRDNDYFCVTEFRTGMFKTDVTATIAPTAKVPEVYNVPLPYATFDNINDMRALRKGFNASFVNNTGGTRADLGFTVNFMGTEYNHVTIFNNGYICFGDPNTAGKGNIDLAIFYTTKHCDLNARGQGTIKFGAGEVYGRKAFGVTWVNVGYQNSENRVDRRNTFQLVIIERKDVGRLAVDIADPSNPRRFVGSFDVEYNYGKINWESCEADGAPFGVGGTSAFVGFRRDWTAPIVIAGSATVIESQYTTPAIYGFKGSHIPGSFLDGNIETSLLSNNIRSIVAGRHTHYFYYGTDNDWLIDWAFSSKFYGKVNYDRGAKLGDFCDKSLPEIFDFKYPKLPTFTSYNAPLTIGDVLEIKPNIVEQEMTVPKMLGKFGIDKIEVETISNTTNLPIPSENTHTVTGTGPTSYDMCSIKMTPEKNRYGTLVQYTTADNVSHTQVDDLTIPETADLTLYRKQDELMFIDVRVRLSGNDPFEHNVLDTFVYFTISIIPRDYTEGKWYVRDTIAAEALI